MTGARVIVVTGLPGTGKSTLARELARRYRLPLAAKDLIKEPLIDVLGVTDAYQSRRLSYASFATLFRLAGEWAASGVSFILEGNFRRGEHEEPLRKAMASAQLAQVLCRVAETERVSRLAARQNDPTRHQGHIFGDSVAAPPAPGCDSFLDLPSVQYVHDGASHRTVPDELDDWMNLRAASP